MEPIEKLVATAQRGDESAFAELTRRHYAMAHAIALSYTADWGAAEEIAQDVFVAIWHNLHTLRHGKAFSIWVRAIARNRSVSWVRQRNSARNGAGTTMESLSENHRADMADHRDTPDMVAARAEFLEMLRTKAAALSPKLREAMTLHYFEGCTVSEGAAALGIPEDTFKKRLRLAREALREEYARNFSEFHLEPCPPRNTQRHVERILTVVAAAPAAGIAMQASRAGALSLAWDHLWHGGSVTTLLKAGLAPRAAAAAAILMLPIALGVASAGIAVHKAFFAERNACGATAPRPVTGPIGSEGMNLRLILGDPAHGDYLLVRGVLPGSPADKQGIRPGDRIVRVAEKPVHAQWHDDLDMRMRGPIGSLLRLDVERTREDGSDVSFNARLVREYIPMDDYWEMWRIQGR